MLPKRDHSHSSSHGNKEHDTLVPHTQQQQHHVVPTNGTTVPKKTRKHHHRRHGSYSDSYSSSDERYHSRHHKRRHKHDTCTRCLQLLAALLALAGIILAIVGACIDRIAEGKKDLSLGNDCKYYCGWKEVESACNVNSISDYKGQNYEQNDTERLGDVWIAFIIIGLTFACAGFGWLCCGAFYHKFHWFAAACWFAAGICFGISLLVQSVADDSCYKTNKLKVLDESVNFDLGISWFIVLGACIAMFVAAMIHMMAQTARH